MAVFMEDLLLKPCYELRLVFTPLEKTTLRLAPQTGDALLLRRSSLTM